jgi:hypothetical protein
VVGTALALCHGVGGALPTVFGIGGVAIGVSGAAVSQAMSLESRRGSEPHESNAVPRSTGEVTVRQSGAEDSDSDDDDDEGICVQRGH